MAYSLQNTTSLSSLGDAIRSKTGGSSNMTVEQMIDAVDSIQVGGIIGTDLSRKKFYTTSTLAVIDGNGGSLFLDTGLSETSPFAFIFTTPSNPHSSSSPAVITYLLIFDGTNLTTKQITGGSDRYTLTFDVALFVATNTNRIIITNNTVSGTGVAIPLNLSHCGYTNRESIDGSNAYVYGTLFYVGRGDL